MKQECIMVYNLRDFDERPYFEEYTGEYGLSMVTTAETPTPENAALAQGCRYVNIITTPADRPLLEALYQQGTRYIVTRTIGYDHIDLDAAKELGIRVANTPYGPDGVAEYTILLMLMCLRNMTSIRHRYLGQDFTLKGLIGRELSQMTVGVIGTGRIGTRLISMLTGFGCRILAYAPHPNAEAKKHAEYVSLETLYRESDLITLHAPANAETTHMINEDALAQMKNGVILVNTGRGALIDTAARLHGLDTGKVGGAGLDVIEEESDLYYYDRREELLHHRDMALLNSYPNVVVTHHMAFYTRQCVETMVRDSVRGIVADIQGLKNPWRVC